MTTHGATSQIGKTHQKHCALGCIVAEGIPRDHHAGRIVWYYGNERYRFVRNSDRPPHRLPDHMVIILPDRYKSSEYKGNMDFFACIVLSGWPRHCYQWWRTHGSCSQPPALNGPNLYMDAPPNKYDLFNKPTFAAMGLPSHLHKTCLHKIPDVRKDVRLHPNSLKALSRGVETFQRLNLAEMYPQDHVSGSLLEEDRGPGVWETTQWGYASQGCFSWGPYNWGRNYQGLQHRGLEFWVARFTAHTYKARGGLASLLERIWKIRRLRLVRSVAFVAPGDEPPTPEEQPLKLWDDPSSEES